VNLAGGVFVNPDTRPGWADRWMTAIGHPSFSGCRYTTLAGRDDAVPPFAIARRVDVVATRLVPTR
jgi:hypothetical protein